MPKHPSDCSYDHCIEPLSSWETIIAALIIVLCTAFTVISIAGGAGWLYETFGAL